MISSDVSGKFNPHSNPSERQREITYLVWNKEALYLYQNELNLKNVHLTVPVDVPDKLSAEHFKPSLKWQCEINAAPFENIIRRVANVY